MKPVDYKQTDPRWANNDYSAKGEVTTIAKSGCGPTCMAMVIASLSNPKITPADTAAWAKQCGYKALRQGTYYTYFVPQGAAQGVDVKRLNIVNVKESRDRKVYHDKALEAVKAGDWVICCMGPGHWTKAGHYILWYGVDGMNALINDPASKDPNRAKAPISKLQDEVKYYFTVRIPGAKVLDCGEPISVQANGKSMVGYLKNGSSFVPVRGVAEAFGATVGWNPSTESVTVNGWPIVMENCDGIAYAKARTLGDLLGLNVTWGAATKTVTFKKG